MEPQTYSLSRDLAYGPVRSRRLGLSLGINLFPVGRKICPFDCIYCEYGKTTDLVSRVTRDGLPSVGQVLHAVETRLAEQPGLQYVTFSGHGEPTLHPHFAEIVDGVVALRDRLQPAARVAVLSCSGVVNRAEVRAALSRVDRRIMKLDAGDEATFQAINRPVSGLKLRAIVDGLEQLDDVVIQHMVLDGLTANAPGPVHEAWVRAAERIQPREVQIYSVDRPTAEAGVLKVPLADLQRLARTFHARTGIAAAAY